MQLTRRTLLAGLATLVGGLVVGTDPIKLISDFQIPETVQRIPYVRIMCEYDTDYNWCIVRYDMLDIKNNIRFQCSGNMEDISTVNDYINRIHKPIECALEDHMTHHSININNIGKLETPTWYKHPDFMMDILKELRYKG